MMQKSWVQRAQRVMFGGRLAPIGVDELNHGLESARDDSTSQSEQQIVLHLSRAQLEPSMGCIQRYRR